MSSGIEQDIHCHNLFASNSVVVGGGRVISTQATSITTAVTSHAKSGRIRTQTATTGLNVKTDFQVNSEHVLVATDVITAKIVSYSGTVVTNGVPLAFAKFNSAGSFIVSIVNVGTAVLAGTLVIDFDIENVSI